MKNQHIPFELIGQLRLWVNKNVVDLIADDKTEELRKIIKIIDYHDSMSLEVSKDLLKKRDELEAIVNTPNEDERMLRELAEKLSSLAKDIKRRIKLGGMKAPSKTLRVMLPDGKIVCDRKAVNTYIKTLQYMGLKRVASIQNIILLSHPAVSAIQNEKHGQLKKVDEYYIEVKTSTPNKAKLLEKYAIALGIDLKVEVTD